MHFLLFLIPLVSVTSSFAAPIPRAAVSDSHSIEKRLPETWYHHRRHPVHELFRRSTTYASVGTSSWSAGFPTGSGTPDPSTMPQAWQDALDQAVSAGKIPDIPASTNDPSQTPAIFYPEGTDPKSPEVCSSSYQCKNPGSIWDGPDGYFGTAFDDGPTPASDTLFNFLDQNNEHATHFMIGSNILRNPNQFTTALQRGDDIAVHTWSHPAMTTLTNEQVVAEIGWTMQMIVNSTNGRVPRFWRPPYGDSDTRVQAIAHEIFGLRTIIWNSDTNDWNMATGQKTMQQVNDGFDTFINGPKSPGLITLEHETTEDTVQAFMTAYPKLKSAGWKLMPVTRLFSGLSVYQNVNGNKVTAHGILHQASDPSDNLNAPIKFSTKAKAANNGGLATVVSWTKSGVFNVLLVSMAALLVI